MLSLILAWALTLLLSLVAGHAAFKGYRAIFPDEDEQTLSFSLTVFLGWVFLATLGSVWYMVAPLGGEAFLFFALLAGIYAGWKRKTLEKDLYHYFGQVSKGNALQLILFAIVLLVALLFSVSPPQYYDDGLYYWQFIKWMNEYAVVPGLGNLHPRLAFNSSWHLLTALLNGSFLPGGPYNDLNGLLYVVLALLALEGLGHMRKAPLQASTVLQASLLIPTHLIVGYFNGPSADAAVVYLVWICLVLFLRKIEAGRIREMDRETFLIIVFSAFVFTVKLSAFPLVVLPLYLLWQLIRRGAIRSLGVIAATALLIGFPWVARSLVLSGYPLFPFYQIDLFSFDWKVPPELVREEVSYIEAFAAGESLVRTYPYPEILQLSMAEWFPLWYQDLRTANKGIFFLVLVLMSGYLVYFLVSAFRRGKAFFREKEGYLVLFFTLTVGLAFWFFKAPDFRFGYAYTVSLYLISLSFLMVFLTRRAKGQRWLNLAFAGLILLFSLRPLQIGLREYYYASKATGKYWLFIPAQPPELPEVKVADAQGGIYFEASSNDQCWDSPLPCTPFPYTGVTFRKPHVGPAAGFRIVQSDVKYYRNMQISYQPLSPEQKEAHRQVAEGK